MLSLTLWSCCIYQYQHSAHILYDNLQFVVTSLSRLNVFDAFTNDVWAGCCTIKHIYSITCVPQQWFQMRPQNSYYKRLWFSLVYSSKLNSNCLALMSMCELCAYHLTHCCVTCYSVTHEWAPLRWNRTSPTKGQKKKLTPPLLLSHDVAP